MAAVDATFAVWDGKVLLFDDGYWELALPLPFGGRWETERGCGGDVEVGFDEL